LTKLNYHISISVRISYEGSDITLTKNFRISRKTNSLKFRHFFLQTIEGDCYKLKFQDEIEKSEGAH
jgi:hypothetical protein